MGHGVVQDVRYALRGLGRSPGFTLTAIAMLALGIGVNAAVFTVTNAVLFRGFPLVPRNDRLMYIGGGTRCCVSYPDFEDYRAEAKSFEGMAIVHGVGAVLGDQSGFPDRYDATEVSAGTFKLVGVHPILGRDFAPSDETPGAAPVAILSFGLWERRFGKDPAILGKTVRLNRTPATVVGVMPRGFSFPQKQDLWVPLVRTAEVLKRENRNTWFAFGRLADGSTVERARAEVETIARRLESAYPEIDRGMHPLVLTFQGFFVDPNENRIYASMWGAVSLVLLIACANLANLMLARAMGRSREISIRIALGAGRWRIFRQLLIESVLLSSLGGVLGWWITPLGVRAFEIANRGPGSSSWRIFDYSMDSAVVAYLAAVSIGTGILFGLAPATRLSKLDMNSALKDGGRSATRRGTRLSGLLVTGEVALAVVLLAGAGVMIRSFLKVTTTDLGLRTENILAARLELPEVRYPRGDAQIALFDRVKARLAAIPGVESVEIASDLPTWGAGRIRYELEGAAPVDDQRRPTLLALVVSPGFFRTLGAAVRSGREFTEADQASATPVAIVNQMFASRFWPGEDAVGKQFRLFRGKTSEAWRTIVGVAPNIVQNDTTRQEFDPLVYLPYRQYPLAGMWVMARTRVSPGGLANAFRRAVQAVDADLPIWLGPVPLVDRLSEVYWNRKLYSAAFLIFGAIALLLASLGLYSVIAHSVSRRTQEIGIRLALGGTARDMVALVMRQGMLPLGLGLIIGLTASLGVNRVLQSALVQVSPADPVAYAGASAVLVLAAVLGCWMPARRAMRVDPAVALRYE